MRNFIYLLYNVAMKKEAFTTPSVISLSQLRSLRPLITQRKIVLVGGCFDVLHYGHIAFLRKARNAGDYLIIAIESDKYIKINKKKIPIHNQKKRAEILAMLRVVDLIIMLPYMQSDKDYFELVQLIKPSIIAVAQGDSQMRNKTRQAESIGGVVEIVTPMVKNFSSSKMVKYENIFSN